MVRPRVGHHGGVIGRGGMGCTMTRNGALGVAVAVAALSGSLLVGCSSDSSDRPAPLVGTWVLEDSTGVGVLQLKADGTCLYESGEGRDSLVGRDACTYESDASTLTFLTSSFCPDSADRATYAYTLTNEQAEFRNARGDDKCDDRKSVMEGAIFTRETTSPNPSAS